VFTGIDHHPEIRDFGDFGAARDILNGTLRIGGFGMPLTDLTPWDLELPSERLYAPLHAFRWLDDMEALSGKSARARAQGWTLGWLDRFGEGGGPGWSPVQASGRLRRFLTHIAFLERDLPDEALARIQTTLPLHMAYLTETWAEEVETAPRVATLTGWITGALCLNGFAEHLSPALAALEKTLAERISAEGTIHSRNPEVLLSLFRDLLAVRALLAETEHSKLAGLEAALARMAPVLRAVRHSDGSLAAFHGGGPGAEALLDRCLAESRVRTRPGEAPAMGYTRLSGGRVQVIVDSARPPERSDRGHASTLAFEMSSGRRRIIVNCGPGLEQEAESWRFARSTPAHSTLSLDNSSSSGFAPEATAGSAGFDALQTRPSMVTLARASDATGSWIQARHDGYLANYGLVHERRIFVSTAGHQVHGEDVLLAPDEKSERRFLTRIKGASKLGVLLETRFHLHPKVTAELDRTQNVIKLAMASGEVWLFRHTGGQMELQPSQYFDQDAHAPVATRQIVVYDRALKPSAELSWSLVLESIPARARRDITVDARSG